MRTLACYGILIGALCLVGCGGRADARPSVAAEEMLGLLAASPGQLPETIGPHDRAVLILLGVDEQGRALVDGAPIQVTAADMRLPRAMAQRRTMRPHLWVMMREPEAEAMRYWTPVDRQSLIRANVENSEAGLHRSHLYEVPTAYSAVHLPFVPQAVVEFVRVDGRAAGLYRFGDQPTDPMVRLQ